MAGKRSNGAGLQDPESRVWFYPRWTRLAALALALFLLSGCSQLDRVTNDSAVEVADEPQFAIVTVTVALTPTPRTSESHYTVQEGDTLSGIAEMFGVTWDAIIQANDLQSQDAIFVGQELLIPSPEPAEPTQTPA